MSMITHAKPMTFGQIEEATSAVQNIKPCRWCGLTHGYKCPIVRAMEFHPDGSLKRVEFVQPSDSMQSLQIQTQPWTPTIT